MENLGRIFGGVCVRPLNSLAAFIFLFGLVLGVVERLDAQTSRYTLNDVMDKLIEIDKRLTVVETEVKRNRELIETVNANLTKQIETVNASLGGRITDTNTMILWIFGFLGSLFLGILVLTFTIYRNTAGLSKGIEEPTEDLARVFRLLEALQGEVKATAERERKLEEKLQEAGVI